MGWGGGGMVNCGKGGVWLTAGRDSGLGEGSGFGLRGGGGGISHPTYISTVFPSIPYLVICK